MKGMFAVAVAAFLGLALVTGVYLTSSGSDLQSSAANYKQNVNVSLKPIATGIPNYPPACQTDSDCSLQKRCRIGFFGRACPHILLAPIKCIENRCIPQSLIF